MESNKDIKVLLTEAQLTELTFEDVQEAMEPYFNGSFYNAYLAFYNSEKCLIYVPTGYLPAPLRIY